jgi:hypothetical protein
MRPLQETDHPLQLPSSQSLEGCRQASEQSAGSHQRGKIMFHSTYRGMNIYRHVKPDLRLRWYTIAPSFAADTLAGIKELIRHHVDK